MVEEEVKRPSAPVGGGEEIPVRLRGKFVPDETLWSTEIQRKLWDGQIALKIDLALDDCISIDKPRSLYIMAPRENYLFYILTDVKSLFNQYAPADQIDNFKDWWFEYNSKPLKWNVPIGV